MNAGKRKREGFDETPGIKRPTIAEEMPAEDVEMQEGA